MEILNTIANGAICLYDTTKKVVSFTKEWVVDPAVDHVIKPTAKFAYNKVIKPCAIAAKEKYIDPTVNNIKNSITETYDNYVAPAVNLIHKGEDMFCDVCDYFRYDRGVIATGARGLYTFASTPVDLIGIGLEGLGSFIFDTTGCLTSDSIESWEVKKGNVKEYIEQGLDKGNEILKDVGINTRFVGDVVNVALLVPSLKEIGRAPEELVHYYALKEKHYDAVNRLNNEFNNKLKIALKEDRMTYHEEMIKSSFLKVSDEEKRIIHEKIEIDYQVRKKTTERRIKEDWNRKLKLKSSQTKPSATGMLMHYAKRHLNNFWGKVKDRVLDGVSFGLRTESRRLQAEREKVDEDFKGIYQMICEDFTARLLNVYDKYKLKLKLTDIDPYDKNFDRAIDILNAPVPSYCTSLMDYAFFQIARLNAANTQFIIGLEKMKNE